MGGRLKHVYFTMAHIYIYIYKEEQTKFLWGKGGGGKEKRESNSADDRFPLPIREINPDY